VALGIVSVFVAVMLGGLSTATLGTGVALQSSIAENLASSQMEYAKGLPFQPAPATYAVIPGAPPGYSTEATAESIPGLDSNIQRVVVTVYQGSQAMLVLEGFKVSR